MPTAPEHGPEAAPAGTRTDAPERRTRILLVCSSGGHLLQLYRLKPWWVRHDRAWVCFEMPDSTSMLAGEQVSWAYHPTTRNIPNLIRNTGLAVTFLKFCSPTKENSRLPAEELVRLRNRASRNGTATSRVM